VRARSPSLAVAAAVLCALAVGACGNTLQDQPAPSNVLEQLVKVGRYPVYWLGGAFHGLAVTNVLSDPGGSYTIQYGDCVEGGQNTCVPPLQVVTSPDNSFSPGGSTPSRPVRVRGALGTVAQGGDTIVVPTEGVVVGVYADRPALARAAAQTMVTVNRVGFPGAPLPAALPNTGFAGQPLASQRPRAVTVPAGG